MIVIVDYGMGNLGSIKNMISKLGYNSTITNCIREVKNANKLILPGVGSFDSGLKYLNNLGLYEPIEECVMVKKTPLLGICLGMQLLAKKSEEGIEKGFAFVDANVKKFNFTEKKIKIPHMGWNTVSLLKEHPLFQNLSNDIRFYFVHSYYVECEKREDILTMTNYGSDFVSSFVKDNIMGVQFHPEKSHKYGMNLLKNFVEM
jgi:glutamine amidotransferase